MIDVEREPEEFGDPIEPCAFCYQATGYWHTPKDVAVCQSCAKTHKEEDVPTKEAWISKVKALVDFDSKESAHIALQ